MFVPPAEGGCPRSAHQVVWHAGHDHARVEQQRRLRVVGMRLVESRAPTAQEGALSPGRTRQAGVPKKLDARSPSGLPVYVRQKRVTTASLLSAWWSRREAESRCHCHQVGQGVGRHLPHYTAPVRLHGDLANAKVVPDLLIQKA
jgi:hypothetical protein